MPAKPIVLAFDLYGTLLSTASIAEKLASKFGEDQAKIIAASWRQLQIEYTQRLNSMGKYAPFSDVTLQSLHHALAESDLGLSEEEAKNMMQAYNTLATFADVAPMMQHLKLTAKIRPFIFTNGTEAMVGGSVKNCPDLSAHADIWEKTVVVEPCRKFKPAPEVYRHLATTVGKDANDPRQMAEMWLVSSNPFDVVGARGVGMKVVWVDRGGHGWQDRLISGEDGRPTVVVDSLEKVVQAVLTQTEKPS